MHSVAPGSLYVPNAHSEHDVMPGSAVNVSAGLSTKHARKRPSDTGDNSQVCVCVWQSPELDGR